MREKRQATIPGYFFVRLLLLLGSIGGGVLILIIAGFNGMDSIRALGLSVIFMGLGSAIGFVYFLLEAVSEKVQQRPAFKIISYAFGVFCFLLFTVICFLVHLTL